MGNKRNRCLASIYHVGVMPNNQPITADRPILTKQVAIYLPRIFRKPEIDILPIIRYSKFTYQNDFQETLTKIKKHTHEILRLHN